MNPKGKAQAPKVIEILERQCPIGWTPAWDPDESGPEWWYDKSKYSQTAPVLREKVCEVSSAPPPIPENISKAVLAWYAQRYRDQAPQSTCIEHSKVESELSAAYCSGQSLKGVGSTNLPPDTQTFYPGPHMRQTHIPGCLASNGAVKKTLLDPPSAISCDYSRRRESSPAVALAATTRRDSTRSPGFEGSSPALDKGLAVLKQSKLPSSESSDARSGYRVANDQGSQGQRLSSSQYLVQPTRNGCIGTPTTAMSENAKLYPIVNIVQPTDTSSGRPMSVTQPMTMQRQPITVHGPAVEKQRHMRSESLSQAPSTASSSTAATYSAHKQTPVPSDRHRNYPALGSVMAPVNTRQTQSHLGGIAATQRPAAAHVPNASIACGKRLRFMYEDSSETGMERPTKSRRTSQNLPPISGEQPPYNSNVMGCVTSVPRLANRARTANGTNGIDLIGQQRAPDPVQRGNVSISKADLVRNLVPGNSEVFADPRNPLVQEYIDAYSHNWLRGYRQMRARGAQTRPYQGVGVPLDRPKAPYQS